MARAEKCGGWQEARGGLLRKTKRKKKKRKQRGKEISKEAGFRWRGKDRHRLPLSLEVTVRS